MTLDEKIIKLLQDRGPLRFGQIKKALYGEGPQPRGVLDHALRRLKKDGVVGLEKIIGHQIFRWALTVRAVKDATEGDTPTL
jgi:DNA-binding HxlR family transcriptional regulator